MPERFQDRLNDWVDKERLAYKAMTSINHLKLDQAVELLIFRRSLFNEGPVEILKHHLYGRQLSQLDFHIEDTLPIIESIAKLSLVPSRIDLGRLMVEWRQAERPDNELDAFLRTQLADHLRRDEVRPRTRDVVLYGFGRIGRLLARILVEQVDNDFGLRLRAVVCRGQLDLRKRANLFKRDSVHGSFKGNIHIDAEKQGILINGCFVQFISADHPGQVDFSAYDIQDALIIDNTGVWRDREGLSRHLDSPGSASVLLTAPGKGDIPNLVYGVNTRAYDRGERIFSAASCTTNAIVPVLKVIQNKLGIEWGHIETVHSFTNDQNLLDNFHKKPRRGRSAPLNMVITSTGAASAVAKAIPELTGKISGNAVRVPTANVSLAILNLELSRETDRSEINEILRQASLFGKLVSQIDHTRDEDMVSSDMVGNRHPAIVDSLATLAEGRRAVVYVWYDNEYGYSVQVVRLAHVICAVEKRRYY